MVQSKIHSALGGYCRIRSYLPVKVVEVKSVESAGENQNPLFTVYGKPPYKKNSSANLQELNLKKEYSIDFKTEKGKTYTIVPL